MTTSHSDIVIHVDEIILIGKMQVIDHRPFISKLRTWLLREPYLPEFSIHFKFFIAECPLLRAGWTIITQDGQKWFITARSLTSLICEPVDDMTEAQIRAAEDYRGLAMVFNEGIDEDAL